jgi:hypothetical protein
MGAMDKYYMEEINAGNDNVKNDMEAMTRKEAR